MIYHNIQNKGERGVAIYVSSELDRVFLKSASHGPEFVFISERELMFTFAICYRPSVCRLSVCLSVVCLSSVTLVHPTQAVQLFDNISTAFGTLAIH